MDFKNLISKSNLFLAPIAGFTDSPFRRIVRKYGAGPVITELISSEGLVRNHKKTLELARFHESERPIGIQIFGKDPGVMGEAASVVKGLNPDFIDLNMGCPSLRVSRSGEGAGVALMRDPVRIREIAENVVLKAGIPVSAKIRTGWDEKNKNYADVVKALEDGGVSFIIVHGRTGAQMYKGRADWDIIREINETSGVPIVGNGDIASYEDAAEKLSFSRCPAVMIGRCAVGNPWIFSGKSPSVREIIDQIREHLNMMLDYYGEKGLILMRKHIVKYIHGIRNASHVRCELVVAGDTGRINDLLENLLLSESL